MKEFIEKTTKVRDLVPLVHAAQKLNVRYQAALDLVLTGALDGVQIGRAWFVFKDALAKAAGTEQPPQ